MSILRYRRRAASLPVIITRVHLTPRAARVATASVLRWHLYIHHFERNRTACLLRCSSARLKVAARLGLLCFATLRNALARTWYGVASITALPILQWQTVRRRLANQDLPRHSRTTETTAGSKAPHDAVDAIKPHRDATDAIKNTPRRRRRAAARKSSPSINAGQNVYPRRYQRVWPDWPPRHARGAVEPQHQHRAVCVEIKFRAQHAIDTYLTG